MNEPLVKMVMELSETGRQTARDMYGANGWVMHHNTDIWRITGLVDGAYWGMWPIGGAWLSQHLYYKYEFNGNKEYLQSVYPVLKEASVFYLDFLVEEPDSKYLVVCPSISPEHGPSGRDVSITSGATIDNQLLFDLFSSTIKSANILDVDADFVKKLEAALKRLAPMQIGKWGQLQEWMSDSDDPDDNHRHVSHLYGMFPSNQISPYRMPELFSAVKTSLLARGDKSTGWSMGWKVNLWARLLDGNHAMKLISDQLSPAFELKVSGNGGTYPNLFDAHPPFQIDGNFGCTSGIAEMLMQSQDGAIHLLPALPDAWGKGTIKGFRARGGFVVDIEWQNSHVKMARVKSILGGNCRIRSYVPLKSEGLNKAEGTNKNEFLGVANVKSPIVQDEKAIVPVKLMQVYECDIDTHKGEVFKVFMKE